LVLVSSAALLFACGDDPSPTPEPVATAAPTATPEPEPVNEDDALTRSYVEKAIAYYNANVMPAPDAPAGSAKVDRKAAVASGALLETPAEAVARVARGGPTPEHYVPTPPTGIDPADAERVTSPYKNK